MRMSRSYSQLKVFETFDERFEYLKLSGGVGVETFGFDRWLNQTFYRSAQWKNVRTHVIARDLGRDLGVDGYEIHERILVHHMNPIVPSEIVHGDESILDPEYLITTTHTTHNAIHFGSSPPKRHNPIERRPGDTKLW